METWAFNHEFWSKHNTEFEEVYSLYIQNDNTRKLTNSNTSSTQKKAAFVEEVLKKNREVGQMSSEL